MASRVLSVYVEVDNVDFVQYAADNGLAAVSPATHVLSGWGFANYDGSVATELDITISEVDAADPVNSVELGLTAQGLADLLGVTPPSPPALTLPSDIDGDVSRFTFVAAPAV